MAAPGMKPYVKLASGLVLTGSGLFTLERLGFGRLEDPAHPMHLGSTIISLLVLVPIGLVLAGALVFMIGKMRWL